MKTSANVLLTAAAFGTVIGALYWRVSREPAGTILLGMMAVGLLIAATYTGLGLRRAHVPADDPNRRAEDMAGQLVGVFAAGSLWPPILALGFAVGLTGLIFGVWLVIPGALLVAAAVLGLLWEVGHP